MCVCVSVSCLQKLAAVQCGLVAEGVHHVIAALLQVPLPWTLLPNDQTTGLLAPCTRHQSLKGHTERHDMMADVR